VFVSLCLVLGSIILFSHSAKQKDHQHANRLALLPLEGDTPRDRTNPSDSSEAKGPESRS
jgi:hypothetical protein